MLQIKSKYKVCKRLGAGVFEQCQTQRYTLSEARAEKTKSRKKVSDYGLQLTEKQKVRYTYGLSERQFARYVKEAIAAKGTDNIATLYRTLEMRLDNVAYRLGLAPTRRAARQMVSHGHILVNGRRMTVPSHRVAIGDALAVREGSKSSVLFTVAEDAEIRPLPVWATFDRTSWTGSITAEPKYQSGESLLNFQVVFEYYSR